MTLQQALEQEKNDLDSKIQFLEKALKDAPNGRMRISHSNGCVQYYFQNVSSVNKSEIISGKGTGPSSGYSYFNDENLAHVISQRDYNKRLLNVLKARYRTVNRTLATYSRTAPEKVFQSFSPDRQKLIAPYILSQEMYIKQWLAEEYPRKPFGENTLEIYTMNGERVRSKSEKIIADSLFRYNIPYRYEFPLHLNELGLVHPDFIVMNPNTREEFFWEHFGMMDDEHYMNKALKKIEAYEKNDIFPGQKLIITTETKTRSLNIRILEKIIRNYFF